MKTPSCLLRSMTIAILAFTTGTLLAGRALADSITFSEAYKDNTVNGVYSGTTDTGIFTGSLTVPGLSALSANDWSNLVVTVTSTQLSNAYTNDAFASDFDDVMSDAVNQGGSLTTTSATFYPVQANDTNGNPVNVVKAVFARSGNTFTFTEQPLSPPALDGPWSLFDYNFADYSGSLSSYAITDQVVVEVTLSNAVTSAEYDDVVKVVNLTGTDTITSDNVGDELNNIRITGSGDFTAPVVTPVSPSGSITTTNGLLSLEVRATDSAGVSNVEFYWNGEDFGSGNPGPSDLWSQIYALVPGTNSFVTLATDSDFNNSSNVINVTYVNRQTNANSLQFSEHWMDFYTVTNSTSTNETFNQDVGVLTAAFLVPGLASMSGDTWSNLVFAISFGDINFSNSLADADVLSPASATFYTNDIQNSVTAGQFTLTRSGNTLLFFARTGNPSYAYDNPVIIADYYLGVNGPITDQEPLSLMLSDGNTLNPYLSISTPIFISGTGVTNAESNGNDLNNIQISGGADFTPTTVQITAPASGQLWSNASFTITGKASDSAAVANVFYSLDNSAWTPANTTNNWTSWFVQVSLAPGSNTLAAYAMETNGIVSPTVSASVFYVVSAILTVTTNGPGSITPIDNNALLQIGKNYTLTAADKPGSGFAFTNWTGGTSQPLSVLTNKPVLEFAMVTNLILEADFVDVEPPVLRITNVLSGMEVSIANLTVSGTATDNVAVAAIFTQLNGTGWSSPTTFVGRNWTDSLSLVPGTNHFQAYAVDTSGNVSSTNTVAIFYAVNATLTVATNGVGSITPNDNNAPLQIGRNYTLTAAAKLGSGFTFTNWTGGTSQPLSVLTNKPVLDFAMVTNLILEANFVDTEAPVLRITNVLSGMEVSIANLTVSGTATDNVAVAAIFTQLNGTGWSSPTTFVGRNWSDSLTLLPGTNHFQAYAVDTSGNVSSTNTVAIFYAVNAPLTVATNGVGSITPNDNNAQLQIGRNYTLTAAAKPGTGFTFTNWTGGTSQPLSVLTNKPVLDFAMVTNLILEANFVDTEAPVLRITNVLSGMEVTNASFTASGTATDNVAVASIYTQLNGVGWSSPTTFVGRNWSDSLTLLPGTNHFQAYAVDTSGNVSSTNTVAIFYAVNAPLTVATNGVGSITPNDNNAQLQIGRNYTLTAAAKPGTGFTFTNWTGGTSQPLSVLTNKPVLDFAMVTNLILEANFVDTEAPGLRITNVLSGMEVTNASFAASGTATDNVAVASIYTQLNGTGWSGPTTFLGRNWSDSLTLLPGTNHFQAYAVDTSGNVSSTNTVAIFYAVNATLTVVTNGVGSITPNDNNAQLQIGRNYTLTAAAKPGSGFTFTNWTGGTSQPLSVLTNKPILEFAMVTNLILEANFVDTEAPTLSITNLVSGERITNTVFTVAGKAGDNVGVATVWLQFNGGFSTNPISANQWTNWTAALDLLPGTNTLAVYAVDIAGNVSPTNKLAFIYVPNGAQFPIATTGKQIAFSVAFTGSNYVAAILGDGVHASNLTAQLFSSSGALLGSRLPTGRTGDVPGGMPVVLYGSNTELMVWQDNAAGTDLPYGQLITNGALQGAAFPVSSHGSAKSNFAPPGIAFGNGQFFVVWNDDRTGTYAAWGRLVATDGTLGPEIQISAGSDDQKHPAVAFDGTNFMVAWVNQTGTSPEQWNIYAALVSADTTVVGTPFQINQTASPSENPLAVAFDGTNYFVAWNRDVGPGSPSQPQWDIYGCLVSPTAAISVSEFPVATGSGDQVLPQITFGQGDYLVLWGNQWYTSSNTVAARFFTTAGQPEGPAFTPYAAVGSNRPLLAGSAFDGARFALVGTLGTMNASGQILSGEVYGTFADALAAPDEFAPLLASRLAPPPASAPQFLPLEYVRQDGALQFRLSAAAGTNGVVVLETSTDLVHWQIVQTNSLPAPGTIFSLPVDLEPAKFIRARMLP